MDINLQYENNRIFAQNENGDIIAEITFANVTGNKVDINHTFVHPSLRGQGVADKLMYAAVNKIKSNGYKAKASCAYALNWLSKHPELSGLLDEG